MAEPYIWPTVETFRRWASDVHAAGGVVTVIPPQWSSLEQGAYAARFPAIGGLPHGSYTYVVAPYAILLWEFGQLTEAQYTLALAEFQDSIRTAGSNVAENIGDLVGDIGGGVGRGLVSAVSGWWWLLLAAGVVLYVSGSARRRVAGFLD